jgi:hypothetical protein
LFGIYLILWNKRQNKFPWLYQFQKLKKEHKPQQVLEVGTVQVIKSEEKGLVTNGQVICSSQLRIKKRSCERNVTGLDEFDLCVVWRTACDYYRTEKQVPTAAALK